MAEPARPSHLRWWFVIAVVVSSAASGGGVYAFEYYTTHVTITGVNWEVFVNGTSQGYLFEWPSYGCAGAGGCPRNASLGTVWGDSLSLSYGPDESNLSVRNVTISSPLTVVGVTPGLPVRLGSGYGTVLFHVSIELPQSPGYFSVLGRIWIS